MVSERTGGPGGRSGGRSGARSAERGPERSPEGPAVCPDAIFNLAHHREKNVQLSARMSELSAKVTLSAKKASLSV